MDVKNLSRTEKLAAAEGLLHNLKARKKRGPKEDAIDAYIPELEEVVTTLNTHVNGRLLANAAGQATLARVDAADCDVDTWYRHTEDFLRVEASRRVGPNAASAKALYAAAFPNGVAHVDAYVPEENQRCRASLAALRAPEHAETVRAIGLPAAFLDAWSRALDESDAAFAELTRSRGEKRSHVAGGRDAESAFEEIAVRLRRYVASRAPKADKAAFTEGQALLAPLLDRLRKAATTKATRATRRNKQAPAPSKPMEPAAQPIIPPS